MSLSTTGNTTRTIGRRACERCRGQKLRCVWKNGSQQCCRCARAKTVCTIPRARPMGRPPRECRGNSAYLGWEDVYSQSMVEDPNMDMQSMEECPPIDKAAVPPQSMNTPPGESPWGLVPYMEGTKAANLPSTEHMDFFDYFTDPTLGGIFSLGLDTSSAEIQNNSTTAAAPNHSDASTPGIEIVTGDRDNADHHKPHEQNQRNDKVQCLTQLCELNVALYQHPLYANPELRNAFNSRTIQTPSSSGDTSKSSPTLSDLKIGSLLSLTVQLRNLVPRIASLDGAKSLDEGSHGTSHISPDRSTALMVLSCYSRLDVIYTRVVEILRDVQRRGRASSDCLMPSLEIDGFSLASCHGIQLTFVIQLCEQALSSVRECMRKCGECQNR